MAESDEILKTQKELAERLGISQPRVSQLIKKGLPKNSDGAFNLGEVKAWTINRASERVEALLPVNIKNGDPSLIKEKIEELNRFKKIREKFEGDRVGVYVGIQGKMAAVVEALLDSADLKEIELIPLEKRLRLAKDLVAAMEDLDTQERLERGESTENVAVLVAAAKDLRRRLREEGKGNSEPTPIHKKGD